MVAPTSNIVYEKSERFEKFKDTAFKMKAGMIELLGDIINVHGDVGGNRVILKMNSKYAVKERIPCFSCSIMVMLSSSSEAVTSASS